MGRRRTARSQYIFALVASGCLVVAGLLVAFQSTGEMRTIGLFLMVLGAVSAAFNVFMRARMR